MPEQRLRRLVQRVAPVVVVNRPLPDADVPIVGVDYVRGIRDLVDHLHALGHRRIAYVSGPASSASNAERLRGVADATGAHPDVRIDVVPGGSRLEDGYAVADAVLAARDAGATAVIAFNDLVALGLMTRLRELGVDVPGDLSIAGFDDVPMASFATPAAHEHVGAARRDRRPGVGATAHAHRGRPDRALRAVPAAPRGAREHGAGAMSGLAAASAPSIVDRAVKRRRVLDVLDRRGAASIVLRSHTAVAWYLDGARTHVSLAGDPVAAVVVRPRRRRAARLRQRGRPAGRRGARSVARPRP